MAATVTVAARVFKLDFPEYRSTLCSSHMPTYEYECGKCGHHFEVFQSMKDPVKKNCPKCKGRVRRLISGGAGLIFKGSGFYITDYRSEGYKSAAKKDSSSSVSSSTTKPSPSKSGSSETGSKK